MFYPVFSVNPVDGVCEQTMVMPCTSVWSVGCLENGDIIVGSR